MNDLKDFCKPRWREGKIVLAVTLAISLLAIAAVATGCGSAKAKSAHGTNIAYVKVLPSKQALRQGVVSTTQIKRQLAFIVGVENSGHFLEQNIKVTLLINQTPQPIRKSLTIGQIRRGALKEVVFEGPFALTELVNVIPIKVNVTPVSGETNLVNNSATYEVRFTF
jgi:hypothetical protein